MNKTPSVPEQKQSPQSAPTADLDLDVEAARRELAEAEAEYEQAVAAQRYCKKCDADVTPTGKGQCPKCKQFLPGNVGNLIHGGRRMDLPQPYKSRRAALKEQVWADLGDALPPIMAEVAEDFVSACVLRDQLVEHLEAIGPLTNRGARRAAMDLYLATSARIERLSAMLGAFRDELKAVAPAEPRTASGLDGVPVSALKDAQVLLSRQLGGEVLNERELGVLAYLRRAIRGEVVLPADQPCDGGSFAYAVASVSDDDEDHPRASNAAPPDLGPDPNSAASPRPSDAAALRRSPAAPITTRCAYCGGPCVGKENDSYRTLHGLDPDEINRKNAEATAEMLLMVGEGVTWHR